MILFHNADIKDLNSIIAKGLISLKDGGENHWETGRRASNSNECVYLFNPKIEHASMTNYGAALICVDIEEAEKNSFAEGDHNDAYEEYIAKSVAPEKIIKIMIPRILKDRAIAFLNEETLKKVEWCEISAEVFDKYIPGDGQFGLGGKNVYREATSEELEQFAKTAPILVDQMNFFRGVTEKNSIIDLSNVRYY